MKKLLIAAAFILSATVTTAFAGQFSDGTVSVSCDTPTAVTGGTPVPIWKVAYCVIGKYPNYTKIDCKDPRAVHTAPTGNEAVCFVGTDRKVHWDYQREVHVGRPFINHRINGRWQPDWQDAKPY